MTRNGDDLPATRETRAAAFAAAVFDSDDGTKKKPDGRIFPLAFNDLLTGEADRIFGDASGVVRSARAARPPRRASWSDFCPASSERVRVADSLRSPLAVAAICATSRPWRSFLTRGRERRDVCRALESGFSNKVTCPAFEGIRKSGNHLNRNVVFSPLNETNVIPMAVNHLGEPLLRQTECLTSLANGIADLAAARSIVFCRLHS